MWQHFDKGDTIKADKAVADAKASDYDALVCRAGSPTRTSSAPTRTR